MIEAPSPSGELPRVLLVLMSQVREDDAANLLVRMEFARWPKDRLAQIYSSESPGRGEFCGRYHRLGREDRFLGSLFLRLRSPVSRMVAMKAVHPAGAETPPGALRRWFGMMTKRLGDLLIRTGVWEVLFPVRLSGPLVNFVEQFRPEIIYCAGYSVGFATLPLAIAERFGIPICFQTLEDWPTYTYARSPVGIVLRRRAAQLVRRSAVRLAFGEKMKEEYERRYGVPFVVTYHLDDPARFPIAATRTEGSVRRVVFTGSMVLNRHEPIADLLAAIHVLQREGLRVNLDVYCTGVPVELAEAVRSAPEVRFLPLPSHDALASTLQRADVLFLPEAFSVGEDRLSLALSTKCHLYMLAGRPILAYGPPYAGSVEYARKEGWALVVEERSVERLADGLRLLLCDSEVQAGLTRRAATCFIKNHDAKSAGQRFEQLIGAAAVRSELAAPIETHQETPAC